MPDHKSALRELLLQQVPLDGSIGNKSLLERLIRAADSPITEADYRQARDRLIAEGLLVAGRGRGGSVMRAPQTQDRGNEEQELSLHAQEAPPPKPAAGRRAPRSAPKPRSAAGQAKQISATATPIAARTTPTSAWWTPPATGWRKKASGATTPTSTRP